MSKLARKPIDVADLETSFENNVLFIKGKHGDLSLPISAEVKIEIKDNQINVSSDVTNKLGLYCALIRNMVQGVRHQFTETLTLKGVGYRASLSNNELNFNLGYSHPVKYKVEDGIKAEIVSPTEIKLTGVDKQLVGHVAAEIIKLRPAKKDPYKEKGIKRIHDRIIKKVGKKVK